jgi:maltooligosyltrehalose synthase
MTKAMREAMVHSRWVTPNIEHERALTNFVATILHQCPDNRFLPDFEEFAATIAYHGSLNSLAQLVIKLASPVSPISTKGLNQGIYGWWIRTTGETSTSSTVASYWRRSMIISSLCLSL